MAVKKTKRKKAPAKPAKKGGAAKGRTSVAKAASPASAGSQRAMDLLRSWSPSRYSTR